MGKLGYRYIEVHARLCKLYPGWTISHMPVDSLQVREGDEEGDRDGGDGDGGPDGDEDGVAGGDEAQKGQPEREQRRRERERGRHHCDVFVANAAVHGDGFRWHVDADPSSFPADCPWTDVYDDYVNGEPNKPLFVSALVYLNDTWPDQWWGCCTS
jgi:hypothetical protein